MPNTKDVEFTVLASGNAETVLHQLRSLGLERPAEVPPAPKRKRVIVIDMKAGKR